MVRGRTRRQTQGGPEPKKTAQPQRFSIAGEEPRATRRTRRGPRAGGDHGQGRQSLIPSYCTSAILAGSSTVLPSVFGTQEFSVSTVYLRRSEEVGPEQLPPVCDPP